MKLPNNTEIRGFDLIYPARGEVVEIRGFPQDGRCQTPSNGRVIVLDPQLTYDAEADLSARAGRDTP